MRETEERPQRKTGALKLLVIVLAVIGVFSIIGTVVSAVFWLIKAVVFGVIAVAILYVLWRVFIGRSHRPDRDI